MLPKGIVSDDFKLSRQTPIRLGEETFLRVEAAAKIRGVKRPAWIREAIMEKLAREEVAMRPVLTANQAALLELCAAAEQRGVVIRDVLVAALEAKLADDASNPQAAA